MSDRRHAKPVHPGAFLRPNADGAGVVEPQRPKRKALSPGRRDHLVKKALITVRLLAPLISRLHRPDSDLADMDRLVAELIDSDAELAMWAAGASWFLAGLDRDLIAEFQRRQGSK